MIPESYDIDLPRDRWVELPQTTFRRASDGVRVPQRTHVRLRHHDGRLSVAFACLDDPHWEQNTYTEHNAALWKQEVFEVFIAAGEQTPARYLEVEINPHNALFVGKIHNPTLEGDALELELIPHGEAGVAHGITETTADSWSGELHIPLSLLVEDPSASLPTTYRLNFYRIVLLEPQNGPGWTCDPANASFQCWRPTLSGPTPRFHRPGRFGTLRLR